jgi:dienelactone hydrolase
MSIRSRSHAYTDGDTVFQARICWDDAVAGPAPGILVSHAWRGRSDFENGQAEALARLGYVGFALDLYGKGILGNDAAENRRLMQPFVDDRGKLQRQMHLALQEIRGLPEVDASRIAAIGFCFGGLCVLDLARSGADIRGVASFHGLLGPPRGGEARRFGGKVLVLHGWDDPMAPPAHVLALSQELTALGADWQIHAYGNTVHAFTNPAADDRDHGLQFNPLANARAMQSLRAFLTESFR